MYIVQEIYKPSTVYKQHTSSVQAIYKLRTVYKQHTRNIQAIYKQCTLYKQHTSGLPAIYKLFRSWCQEHFLLNIQQNQLWTLKHRSWYWYLLGMFWVASFFSCRSNGNHVRELHLHRKEKFAGPETVQRRCPEFLLIVSKLLLPPPPAFTFTFYLFTILHSLQSRGARIPLKV